MEEFDTSWAAYTRNQIYCIQSTFKRGTERWLRLLHLFCHSIGGDRACVKRLSQWTAHYSEKIQFCARGIFIPRAENTFQKPQLHRAINQRLTPTQKFTPKDLIAAMKALNVELGLIIDLTYTTRYYEVKDLPKSVQYKKLYTVGLEVPDNATILQFKKWVRKFLWENARNEKLIGVHCTNGINRTGYLICRYLIDVEGWDPEAAIQAFGDARGHCMDGLVYLTDLRTQPMRSNLGMDVWDSDEDIIPPPNATEGPVEQFPNEDFQG